MARGPPLLKRHAISRAGSAQIAVPHHAKFSAEREGSDRRDYATRTPPSGAGYLSVKQVRDLWEAASFLVQMFGLFLNTRISIRHGRLGIDDPRKVGPFLTSLMHELRMLINDRAASTECPEPFHWLYVNEHSPTDGAITHVVATVPMERETSGHGSVTVFCRITSNRPVPLEQ